MTNFQRMEIVFLVLFAAAGLWQVRTWLNAGVERFRRYMYNRLAQQLPRRCEIKFPLRHECFTMPMGDSGEYTHTDEIVDAKGHRIAIMSDGCDDACSHFKFIVDTMNKAAKQ